ncbi:MAG: hypothetical protein V4532_15475 [Pseudomonadota bacterium]
MLMQTSALAAPSAEDLSTVKLYGNVTIAQDSTDSWGPWEQFEPPSAGPVKLSQLKFGTEPYRPLSKGNRAEPEANPQLIGFGAFINSTDDSKAPHAFSMTGKIIEPANNSTNGLVQALSLQITPLTSGTPAFSNTGELTLFQGEGGAEHSRSSETETVSLRYVTETLPGQNTAEVNVFAGELGQYIKSSDGDGGFLLTPSQTWAGVIGTPTSFADMNNLRGSNAHATYSGLSFDNEGGHTINMTYAFGPGTGTISESRFTANVKSSGGATYTATSLSGVEGSGISGG